MIKLDLTTAVSIYQFVLVAGVLTAWIVFEYTKNKHLPDQDESFIWQCSVCTHLYLTDKDEDITRCPSCKSYNKRADDVANSSRAKSRGEFATS